MRCVLCKLNKQKLVNLQILCVLALLVGYESIDAHTCDRSTQEDPQELEARLQNGVLKAKRSGSLKSLSVGVAALGAVTGQSLDLE